MIVKKKSSTDRTPDEVVSDTTMMFMACAAYVLHERNHFGKGRIMQFIADIEQVNRECEYEDLRKALNDKFGLNLPEVNKDE